VSSPEARWRGYLHEAHSEQTLRRWARRLSIFRFCRAYGGHANDGDQLLAVFRYASIPQLLDVLRQLGIEPVIHTTQPPQPEPGKPYPADEFERFPSLIDGTWIEQPGHCTLHGAKGFVWCWGGRMSISVHTGYSVTEDDAERAGLLEPLLAALRWSGSIRRETASTASPRDPVPTGSRSKNRILKKTSLTRSFGFNGVWSR
jgi:hypothetical protein